MRAFCIVPCRLKKITIKQRVYIYRFILISMKNYQLFTTGISLHRFLNTERAFKKKNNPATHPP